MADEVNDMLQSAGRVVVAELSRQFNLPMDFLVEVSCAASASSVDGTAVKGARDVYCLPPLLGTGG